MNTAIASLAYSGFLIHNWTLFCSNANFGTWKNIIPTAHIVVTIISLILIGPASSFKEGALPENLGFKVLGFFLVSTGNGIETHHSGCQVRRWTSFAVLHSDLGSLRQEKHEHVQEDGHLHNRRRQPMPRIESPSMPERRRSMSRHYIRRRPLGLCGLPLE